MQFHHDFLIAQKVVARHTNPHDELHRAEALALKQSKQQAQTAQKRFYRLYHLRNLLFRIAPRLANRLAL